MIHSESCTRRVPLLFTYLGHVGKENFCWLCTSTCDSAGLIWTAEAPLCSYYKIHILSVVTGNSNSLWVTTAILYMQTVEDAFVYRVLFLYRSS